jgi:hypothetical protein
MTEDQLGMLRIGDIIRHKDSGDALVVTGNYGGRVTAVRTYDVTNPSEWDIVGLHRMASPPKAKGKADKPPPPSFDGLIQRY